MPRYKPQSSWIRGECKDEDCDHYIVYRKSGLCSAHNWAARKNDYNKETYYTTEDDLETYYITEDYLELLDGDLDGEEDEECERTNIVQA